MELSQWLAIYHAVAQSAATRERNRWTLLAGGLVMQSILAIAASFFVFIEPSPFLGARFVLIIALSSVGLLTGVGWTMMLVRLRAQALHFDALSRGIESQFAGAEFFRSLHRLSAGEKVCTPTSHWSCNEWLPSVSRLPLSARALPEPIAMRLLSWPFILGWIALLVFVLTA
jgi:hypothetical protein